MIKILQYGEGNFLRTFVDAYFNQLNDEGGSFSVTIVKPIPYGSLEKFYKQNNLYSIVLRGVENEGTVERVYNVSCIDAVIDPFENSDAYTSAVLDKDLKIVVSNTTEAGICFCEKDSFEDFANITYPAKLTKALYARYVNGLGGVYLLPVELIDNNGDRLKEYVDRYAKLWGLGEDFIKWNDTQNFYCNTLVDRIVSGYPKDAETKEHLEGLIGKKDELVSIGEPFGLWAIEKKGEIDKIIQSGKHNIEVVFADDIGYYKKRKVRILNGSHTNLVALGLVLGKKTVYDCMMDDKIIGFIKGTLSDEIIPYVSSDFEKSKAFANSVMDRFMNPFLNHQLVSISLNSISKWRERVLPTFRDYYRDTNRIATNITIGFSYLMALYSSVERRGEGFTARLPYGDIEVKDNFEYLNYFANKNSVREFMQDEKVFGEDLTQYVGFADAVEENLKKIAKGISLI